MSHKKDARLIWVKLNEFNHHYQLTGSFLTLRLLFYISIKILIVHSENKRLRPLLDTGKLKRIVAIILRSFSCLSGLK